LQQLFRREQISRFPSLHEACITMDENIIFSVHHSFHLSYLPKLVAHWYLKQIIMAHCNEVNWRNELTRRFLCVVLKFFYCNEGRTNAVAPLPQNRRIWTPLQAVITSFKTRGYTTTKIHSVALVCKRTIQTERPPLDNEVSTNFCG
jgi:hypothetical protein